MATPDGCFQGADPWGEGPQLTLNLPQSPAVLGINWWIPWEWCLTDPHRSHFRRETPTPSSSQSRTGRLVAVTNRSMPDRTLVLDLTASTAVGPNEGLLAVEPHPAFGSNGRVFFSNVRIPGDPSGQKYIQISEFRLAPDTFQPNGSPEIVLIRQPYSSLDHLGGDLKFGANGYLHASIGDGFDPLSNAQRIDRDFFACFGLTSTIGQSRCHRTPSCRPGNYRIPLGTPM